MKLCEYSKLTIKVYLNSGDDFINSIIELMKNCKSVDFFLSLLLHGNDSLSKLEGLESSVQYLFLMDDLDEDIGVFLRRFNKLQSFRFGNLRTFKCLNDICFGLLNSSETL